MNNFKIVCFFVRAPVEAQLWLTIVKQLQIVRGCSSYSRVGRSVPTVFSQHRVITVFLEKKEKRC